MSKIIISITSYNRPEKIKNLLDSIKYINLSRFIFFFFIDGPKNINDTYLIDQTLKKIKNFIRKKKVKIFIQKKNLGLKKHLIFSMDKTFQKTNKAIFLEDDLILSKNFFKFVSLGLDKYEMVEKVKSVCGHLPIKIKAKKNFFAHRTSSWGYGTWKRVWDEYKFFMKKKSKYNLNFNNKKNLIVHGRDLHTALARNIIGKQNTHAIWWLVSIIMNKGLNLYPAETLVNNDGFDGTGTNCIKTNFYKTKFNNKRSIYNMPRKIEIDDKLSFRISKKIIYSKAESFLYLYCNARLAYIIIFMYLSIKAFFTISFFKKNEKKNNNTFKWNKYIIKTSSL